MCDRKYDALYKACLALERTHTHTHTRSRSFGHGSKGNKQGRERHTDKLGEEIIEKKRRG